MKLCLCWTTSAGIRRAFTLASTYLAWSRQFAHRVTDERHRGEYKTHNNRVEAFKSNGESIGIAFETATPHLMEELIAWTQTTIDDGELHSLISIVLFVIVFLEIHPFQDGNGRLSRILTTLMLLRAGCQYVPYSSHESVIERSKEAYYLALCQTQA